MSTTKSPPAGAQRVWTADRQDVQARQYTYALMALADRGPDSGRPRRRVRGARPTGRRAPYGESTGDAQGHGRGARGPRGVL